MRILFTNVPWYGEGWHGIKAGCRWPFILNTPKPPADTLGFYNTYPFFLGYAAAYLKFKANNEQTYFYDALAHAHTYDTFYEYTAKLDPEIVVIETSTPSIDNDLEVAKSLKKKGSEIALVGPHASVYAEALIKLPFVDYILQGEFEVSAYEMVLMRKKKIYKSRPLMDLDSLSMSARDNSCLLYADGFGQDKFMIYPQLQIWTSRGCPFKCDFCLWNHTMWTGGYRKRSPKSVTKEITSAMGNWGIKSVLLDDDTFNVGDEHTIAISDAIDKIAIQWHAMVRPDTCSKKAFMIMRECGCVGLKIGVETFSQCGLDSINKGYNADELYETIDFLMDLGFKVFLSLMDNIPGETEKDRELTKKRLDYFIKKGASYQHPTYMPLPGTNASIKRKNKPKENWKDYGQYHPNEKH